MLSPEYRRARLVMSKRSSATTFNSSRNSRSAHGSKSPLAREPKIAFSASSSLRPLYSSEATLTERTLRVLGRSLGTDASASLS